MIDYFDGKEGRVAVIAGDSHASAWCRENNRLWHRDPALEEARRHLRPGHWVIECGSCIGVHTLAYARAVGGSGAVIAFEANPECAQCTAFNTRDHPCVEVRNLALGSAPGRVRLKLDANVGASHLAEDGEVEVERMTLDEAVRGIYRADFVKLDVEGCEVAVLSGAREIIRRFSPMLLVEVNHGALERQGTSAQSLLALIESLGYQWRGLDERHDPRTWEQTDVFCWKA